MADSHQLFNNASLLGLLISFPVRGFVGATFSSHVPIILAAA